MEVLKKKSTLALIGAISGAAAGVLSYVIYRQRTNDPFDSVNDIRKKYEEEDETEIEAENMVSEGAMSSVNYANKWQE
ncbi:hypothetical protein [Listeria fleischmannii]|uniref:hypothetical protein n=2 Tax=Listeria fleischmannii TaxID=1069827 RepID=UPI0020FFFF72|nr:hypothetical protein [Listeria fleischmannii]